MAGRKGMSLMDLPQIGITLVLIGVVVAVGLSVNNQVAQTALPTVSVKCEAVTWATNVSAQPVAYPYIHSIQAMYNGSTCGGVAPGILIDPGNYSTNGVGIILNLNTGPTVDLFGSGIKYVNYTTWNTSIASGQGRLMLENSTRGLADLASWLPIIAIVIAAAVVIGILVKEFKGF